MTAGVVYGLYFAADTAVDKTAGNYDTIDCGKKLVRRLGF